MISVRRMYSSAADAAKYYTTATDYYADAAEEQGVWAGKGAEKLGLTGPVERDELERTLNGKLPNGHETSWDQETGQANGKDRAMGWDFTFAPPKSVSIMMLVAGDDRLKEAVKESAKLGLAYLEKYAAVRQRMPDGTIMHKATGNLVASQHFQISSRALDPHAHVHTPVNNTTYDDDRGKWYALESLHLFRARKAADRVAIAHLAHRTQELGYALDTDEKAGSFEIADFPKAYIELSSKRTDQIEKEIKEKGLKSHAAKRAAQEVTRDAKEKATQEGLTALWQEEAGDYLPLITEMAEKARANARQLKVAPKEITRALTYAQERAHGTEAVVDEFRIVDYALQLGVGKVTPGALFAKMADEKHRERMLETEKTSSDEPILRGLTSRKVVQAEQRFLKELERGRGAVSSILDEKTARERADAYRFGGASGEYALNADQNGMVVTVLTTRDRYVAVQGVGGAGKSQVIDAISRASPGRTHIGVAPTSRALQELVGKADVETKTLQGMVRSKARGVSRGSVVYVDENSMSDTVRMAELTKLSRENGFRIVGVGDWRQKPSIQAGRPHEDSLTKAATVVALEKSMRQQAGSQADRVARVVKAGQRYQAEMRKPPAKRDPEITKLNPWDYLEKALGAGLIRYQEKPGEKDTPSQDDKMQAVIETAAEAWLNDPDPEKGSILVFDNMTRTEVNNTVRGGLIERGVVEGEGAEATILKPTRLMSADLKQPFSYSRGQVAVFHGDDAQTGFQAEDRAVVTKRDQKSGVVYMRRLGKDGAEGKPRKFFPGKHETPPLQLYDLAETKIAKGDKIIFTRNEGEFINGVTGVVSGANGREVTIDSETGEKHTLNLDQNRHWDHAYGITIYKAQGATMNVSRAILASKHGSLLNAKDLYTAATRARDGVEIYTDNFDPILKQFREKSGRKTSALEALDGRKAAPTLEHVLKNAIITRDNIIEKLDAYLSERTPDGDPERSVYDGSQLEPATVDGERDLVGEGLRAHAEKLEEDLEKSSGPPELEREPGAGLEAQNATSDGVKPDDPSTKAPADEKDQSLGPDL